MWRRLLVAALLAAHLPAEAAMVEDCSQEGDWWLRVSACTQAIDSGRWPGAAGSWAFSNRAVAHAALGNYLEAFDDHETAVRLNPDDARARNNKANSHADFREYGRALDEYAAAVRLRPGYVAAHFNRAGVLVAVGRFDEAAEDYTVVIEARPDLGSAYLGRAEARCRLGQHQRSLQDRMRAMDLGALSADRAAAYLTAQGYGPSAEGMDALQEALGTWTEAGCP